MAWLSILGSILYYLSLPFAIIFTTIYNWLIIGLAPILHLGHYLLSGLLLPLKLIAKFEVGPTFFLYIVADSSKTLYIYLGVAAVIGLLTGFLLHISSSILVSLFNLNPAPEETTQSAASVRAARETKKLEQAWQSSTFKSERAWKAESSRDSKYAEWLETDLGKRREDQGLFRQTILEEEDDSEDGF
jgi:hypothetical protein